MNEGGVCKFAEYCVYAHSKVELRKLTDPMPLVPSNMLLFKLATSRCNNQNSKKIGVKSKKT